MPGEDHPPERPREPPLIERARRTGWALLVLSLGTFALARAGPEGWRSVAVGSGVALALLGLLAIVNVALVRGLYRQLAGAHDRAEDRSDQSM